MRPIAWGLRPAHNAQPGESLDGASMGSPIPGSVWGGDLGELWPWLLLPLLAGLAASLFMQGRALRRHRAALAQAREATMAAQLAYRKAQGAQDTAQQQGAVAAAAKAQKAELLARMSYSIRSNLNGMLGYITLIGEDELSTPVRQQYIDIILRRGQNLLSLTQDVISITQIESNQVEIKPVPTNLNQLLEAIRQKYTPDSSARRGLGPVSITVTHALAEPMCWVMLDPMRLEQVFAHLLDNALRHTHRGTIEFGYRLKQLNRIQFHVRDTGTGIPAQLQDRVFRDYFLPHQAADGEEFVGTGLGLTICNALVERMGGGIHFESAEGKGSTFYFHLPFVPAQPSDGRHISRSLLATKRLDLSGRNILVVEDDLISFQLIDILLRPTRVRLIHVKNGEDALEVCQLMDRIDLVLMDMQLPFMDGFETTRRIKSIRPTLPVIAQTANTLAQDRQDCLAAGCNDYLSKPIDSDELLLCIAHHLG